MNNNQLGSTAESLVVNKALLKEKGLIYASLYCQLQYLYELHKSNGKLNDDGYFNYKMKFLASIFQFEYTYLVNFALYMEGDKLVKIRYINGFDKAEIKVLPLPERYF